MTAGETALKFSDLGIMDMASTTDAVMEEIETLNGSKLTTLELIDAFEEIISDLECRVQALRDDLEHNERGSA